MDSDADIFSRSYILPASGRTGISYLSRTQAADAVLYLDYDGVLHHDAVYRHHRRGIYIDQERASGHRLFEYAPLLERALAPYPDLRIVLSTTWVRVLGFQRARDRLPTALADRVIGATFHSQAHGQSPMHTDAFLEMSRGEQVWADVTRRRPKRWLALDDAVDDWPVELADKLVACDSSCGLGDPAVELNLWAALQQTFGAQRTNSKDAR